MQLDFCSFPVDLLKLAEITKKIKINKKVYPCNFNSHYKTSSQSLPKQYGAGKALAHQKQKSFSINNIEQSIQIIPLTVLPPHFDSLFISLGGKRDSQ